MPTDTAVLGGELFHYVPLVVVQEVLKVLDDLLVTRLREAELRFESVTRRIFSEPFEAVIPMQKSDAMPFCFQRHTHLLRAALAPLGSTCFK